MNPVISIDVLVAGLGPAGANAAKAAALGGRRVIAIDRKREAGVPVQCAEFIPQMLCPTITAARAARCQGVGEMQTYVESEPPDCQENFPGVMVDRQAFDRHLVDQASDAGAECRFKSTITTIDPNGTVHLNGGERIKPTVLIGADGPRSRTGRSIGSLNKELVATRQITVPLPHAYTATDIFLSTKYAGGYAWLFPRGDRANVGLGLEPRRLDQLHPLLASLHSALVTAGRVDSNILSSTGGVIPVGGMQKPTGMLEQTLVVLCGDAAGLTNPVTGAGISSAVLSGTLAGESACDWLEGNLAAAEAYIEELNDLFGRALRRAVQRRREILALLNRKETLSPREMRRSWIAYPEYWAA